MPTATAQPPPPPPISSPSPMDSTTLIPLLNRPDAFLRPSHNLSKTFLNITKTLYDLSKPSEPFPNEYSHIQKLLVDGFDAEQVWEMLDMQNGRLTEYLEVKVQDVVEGRKDDSGEGSEGQVEFDGMDLDMDMEEELEGMSMDEENGNVEMESELDEASDEEQKADEDGDEWDEGFGEEAAPDSDEEDNGNTSEIFDSDQNNDEETSSSRKRKSTRSIVDDDFFSLEEMERFADFGEARDIKRARRDDDEENDEEEDEFAMDDLLNGDLDDEDSEDEGGDNANDIKYEDFFGPRENQDERLANDTKHRVRFADKNEVKEFHRDGEDDGAEEGGEDGHDEENGGDGRTTAEMVSDLFSSLEDDTSEQGELSTFEKQQAKLQKQISALESEAIADKHWTLKGEAASRARPINSLLEEELEYEHAAKPVPVITEEKTSSLEDLIRQRIKDHLFDDVIRKAPPRDRDYDPNRRIEIDETKSKKGLAEVYEEDYVRATHSAVPSEKDDALKKQHEEISTLFTTLCQNLDALSNWHFTPKPITTELEVVPLPNIPALQMEEITPSHVADSTLTAPQEVFAEGVTKSATELSANDKKRLRDKSRKKAGKERKVREEARKAVDAARPKTAGSERREKEGALKMLMGKKNVTIIGDGRMKRDMGRVGGKGKKRGMEARVVEKGGRVQGEKTVRGSDLRL